MAKGVSVQKQQKQNRLHFYIGAVAIPLAAVGFAMTDTHADIAKILFVVAGIAFVWGVWPFIFCKRHKKHISRASTSQTSLPTINYEKIGKVTSQDKELIQTMNIRMMATHGHMDLTGLMSDRANGVDIDELMSKPCSLCGVSRNKRGRR